MKRHRKFNKGLLLLLYFCLQFLSRIHLVHSTDTRVPRRTDLSPVFYQGVHGKPGVDFPVLTAIPKTAFSCRDIETGYYADLETSCQVFHICEDGKKTSFLCPNGTIFQQSDLICDWWFKVNCNNSPLLYEESSEQLKEELIKKKSARKHKVTEEDRPIWSDPKKDVPIQNEFSTNDEIYEQKKSKTSIKQNWSSVYNEPQWKERENNRQMKEEYSSTETFLPSSERSIPRRKNGYRKIVMRKKPVVETTKSKYKNSAPSATTEEIIMTVTPETTSKIKIVTPTKQRFRYIQKPYSSTIRNEAPETTTSSFYINKKKNVDLTGDSNPENGEEKSKLVDKSRNEYVNIFVGTRQKVLRANNQKLSNKYPCKSCEKATISESNNEKKKSSTRYLNGESNTLSEDSEETQVPEETASIVGNRFNSFNKAKEEKTSGFYENHKPEYSEIQDPKLYNEKYFSNIVPVTSQYVTTQSFNNRNAFVGSSVGTPIPRNKTTTNYQRINTLDIGDHNKKTFKLSAIAFKTAEALNPFQNGRTPSDESLDDIKPTKEISTVAYKTADDLDENIRTYTPTVQYSQPSTEPPLPPLDITPKEDTKKDLLKHSTISLNTAQAYESLFSEETKSPLSSISSNDFPDLPPPIEVTDHTEAPFTSRRLEIPTTTENDATEVQTQFNENLNQDIYSTERIQTTTTVLPTRSPLPPLKPRPFAAAPTEPSPLRAGTDKSERQEDLLPYPFFRISTASPFALPGVAQNDNLLRITDAPTTEPTSFYIKPDEVEVNDDNGGEQATEGFRPGLVVPSSVSPLTLHTLAAYFENAVSNMTSEERASLNLDDDSVGMEEKLRVLLSNMTKQKYEQLFNQIRNSEVNTEYTTVKEAVDETTENPEDTQKARKLAKLFSQALSEYLNDPTNFKNRLIQVRPTEPPSQYTTANTEKELLSFSEDDSKNSLASLYNTSWNFNKTNVNEEQNSNYIAPDTDGLSIADSQSFVSQFNNLNYEDKKKVAVENLPKNHWTSSPHATNLWRTTFAVDPFSLNKDFHATESYTTVTQPPQTENYSDLEPSSLTEEEIKYELRVFPKLASNSSKLQGILIDFMNSSTSTESERLHRILRKLNTTEDEFLDRMKKIEENPLTRRLILLLIHECEATKNEKQELIPFLNPEKSEEASSLNDSSSEAESANRDQDARALQLLNSLYNIATKFGR